MNKNRDSLMRKGVWINKMGGFNHKRTDWQVRKGNRLPMQGSGDKNTKIYSH